MEGVYACFSSTLSSDVRLLGFSDMGVIAISGQYELECKAEMEEASNT